MRRIGLIACLMLACLTGSIVRAQEQAESASDGSLAPAPNLHALAAENTAGLLSSPGVCLEPIIFQSYLDTVYVAADFMAFRRDWQANLPVATLDNSTNTVLKTNDLNFVSQPGLRMLLGARLTDFYALETTFLGLFKWDESKTITNASNNPFGTAGNLFSPLTHFGNPPQAGLDYNYQMSIHTASDFNSGELNLRQRLLTPPSVMQVSALYGLRYLNVHERFEYRSRSHVPVLGGGTADAVNVETNNNMFGVQIGGTLEYYLLPRSWVSLEGKGILLRNGATQDTQYTSGPLAGPTATTVDSSGAQSRVSLAADVSATVLWKFTPALVGRFGYQGVFVDGLALGADNFLRNAAFITSGPTDVYRNSRLAYHGPFAGLIYTW